MALSFCILANYMCAFSSVCKESACNAGDVALIPGWERSPEEGNGNLLQYSCLENSMDRGALQAIVHGVPSRTWLNHHICAQLLNHVQIFVAHQTSLVYGGFPRQESWSVLPFPFQGYHPDPGIKPKTPALTGRFFTTKHLESPVTCDISSFEFFSSPLFLVEWVFHPHSKWMLSGIFAWL